MTPEQEAVKAEAIQAAGQILAMARAKRDALSPREAAEAAWFSGHPLKTVDAIEALIVSQRAAAVRRAAAASSRTF